MRGELITRLTHQRWTCVGKTSRQETPVVETHFARVFHIRKQDDIQEINAIIKKSGEVERPTEKVEMSMDDKVIFESSKKEITRSDDVKRIQVGYRGKQAKMNYLRTIQWLY